MRISARGWLKVRSAVCAVLLAMSGWAAAGAQDQQFADARPALGGPRFLLNTRAGAPIVDSRSVMALQRRVTLTARETTLGDALRAITRQTGVTFALSRDVVPVAMPVRVEMAGLSLAAALTELLLNTEVDVAVISGTELALVKRHATALRSPPAGTVTGRVTDSTTSEGVGNATVSIEGARLSTVSDVDGRYTLRGVAAGAQTVVARKIGYTTRSRRVNVQDDATATADFVLYRVPTSLHEIVVTPTGEQQKVELGHVIGHLDAERVVKEAPVSTLSDLLTARVAGLSASNDDAQVGGNAKLRIRAVNTVYGNDQQPVIVVDGVRYANPRGAPQNPLGTIDREGLVSTTMQAQTTSRMNDININDIESIEVVKGSAAATLYGADAANGVIVITTKRGVAGRAKWRGYTRYTSTEIPKIRYPDMYFAFSTLASGAQRGIGCALFSIADGACVRDSTGVFPSPLNDPNWTVFGRTPRYEFGGNVSGGSDDVRYYLSADNNDATGPVRMPPGEVELMKQRLGVTELRDELVRPNHQRQSNARANLSTKFGRDGDATVTLGYTDSDTRTFNSGVNVYNANIGTPVDTSKTPYSVARTPGQSYALSSTEYLKRFTLASNGRWQPNAWLAARLSGGVDVLSTKRLELARRGENFFQATGTVGDTRTQTTVTTMNADVSATRMLSLFSTRSFVGAQVGHSVIDRMQARRDNLTPGGESFQQATTTVEASQAYVETATLGFYVDETVGWKDRLFLNGAVRFDRASTYEGTVANPKVSVSWLASQEPLLSGIPHMPETRLRYAYGSSTIQPQQVMAMSEFTANTQLLEGSTRGWVSQSRLGNPDLQPEQAFEHEWGADVSAFDQRLSAEVTWYRRRTLHGLYTQALPQSLAGYSSQWVNIGEIRNRGFEAQVTGRPWESRRLTWDISLLHSNYTNKLVDLGNAENNYAAGVIEGYPLGAAFNNAVSAADTIGGRADGLLSTREVVWGAPVYIGPTIAPREQTLSNTLSFNQGAIRVSAVFNRRSGYVAEDGIEESYCSSGYCWAAFDSSSTIEQQLRVVANRSGGSQDPGYKFWKRADATRLKELSVSAAVPGRLARHARAQDATITLQGRNLKMWTDFTGPDPESSVRFNTSPVAPLNAIGIPQGRTWVVRVDVGF